MPKPKPAPKSSTAVTTTTTAAAPVLPPSNIPNLDTILESVPKGALLSPAAAQAIVEAAFAIAIFLETGHPIAAMLTTTGENIINTQWPAVVAALQARGFLLGT